MEIWNEGIIFILNYTIRDMKKEKQVIDENVEYFLREGTLPNGIQPIVMNRESSAVYSKVGKPCRYEQLYHL